MFFLLVITFFGNVLSNATESSIGFSRCSPFTACDEHYSVAGFAKVNWFQANHICNSAGLVLATVNNWEQHLDLLASVARTGNILGERRFWLGATNQVEAKSWTWLSIGKPGNPVAW